MRTSIDLVIPAFNVADIIEQTIQRISEQRLPDDCRFQVYVFDDASTDDTPSVLAGLQEQFDFLHVVRAGENVGRGEARNRGAAAGSGSIIVFCDADCRYTRDDAVLEFIVDIEKGGMLIRFLQLFNFDHHIQYNGFYHWVEVTNGRN